MSLIAANATISGYADVVRNSDGWLLRRTDRWNAGYWRQILRAFCVGRVGFVTNDTQRVWLSREGAVGIGAAPGAADVLRIGGTFSTASSVVRQTLTPSLRRLQGAGKHFATMAATAAASFSMSSLVHFAAAQGVWGWIERRESMWVFVRRSLVALPKNWILRQHPPLELIKLELLRRRLGGKLIHRNHIHR